jgi:hypothetical protein
MAGFFIKSLLVKTRPLLAFNRFKLSKWFLRLDF